MSAPRSRVNRRLAARATACALLGAGPGLGLSVQAQQAQPHPPAVKSTFVRLVNNANAVIVEPAIADPQRARFAILLTHPEHANTFNYFIGRELSKRGYRVMMMNYYGPEQEYEEFLVPLAAAVKYLRGIPGVQKVVLAGHSTGGPVLALYQDVAENGVKACRGDEVVYSCRGKDLDKLPAADAIMMLDSNAGAVERLVTLDPAIDSRPRERDPRLDMFDPRNGFDAATHSGNYSPEFRTRFLRAQAARQARLIAAAAARLAKIEKGLGDYQDDEPFVVAGSSAHTNSGARLDLADGRLLSKTHAPHPLIKADGTMPVVIVRSTRAPDADPAQLARLDETAQDVTVRHFLSFMAMRTTPEYDMTEDRMTGVEWRSVGNSLPGSVQGIRVPSLFMSATCAPHLVFTEIAYDQSAARDKEFIGVEGADHSFRACKPEYGDPAKAAFDYVDRWLTKPGRF